MVAGQRWAVLGSHDVKQGGTGKAGPAGKEMLHAAAECMQAIKLLSCLHWGDIRGIGGHVGLASSFGVARSSVGPAAW